MMGVVILVSVLAATIPVGFFKPAPLDDITINLNLGESPKGQHYGNTGHYWGEEEEEDTDASVDQGEQIPAPAGSCGVPQGIACGVKFGGAVVKCATNPTKIPECIKDVVGDDNCKVCICDLIHLASADIPCLAEEEEEEDTDASVYQPKGGETPAPAGSCGFPQDIDCGVKFAESVTKCAFKTTNIPECIKDVVGDDNCKVCICEIVHWASADIPCSAEEEEEEEDTDASVYQPKGGDGHCVEGKLNSCLDILGEDGKENVKTCLEKDNAILIRTMPAMYPIMWCLDELIGESYCKDCICDLLEHVGSECVPGLPTGYDPRTTKATPEPRRSSSPGKPHVATTASTPTTEPTMPI